MFCGVPARLGTSFDESGQRSELVEVGGVRMEKIFSMRKRIARHIALAALITLTPACSDESITYAPYDFPFDASRANVTRTETFRVRKLQYWVISLNFYHQGGENAQALRELLDANEAVFLTSSIDTKNPIRITSDDFLEKEIFETSHEFNMALTRAELKYQEALQSAIHSRLCKQKGKYSYVLQNQKGAISLHVKLTSIDASQRKTILLEQTLDTLGFDRGGNGRFSRPIETIPLGPEYSYELTLKTIHDSPPFFEVPIRIGIGFDPKMDPPHSMRTQDAENHHTYCESKNTVHRSK
jgi:hypothetical protein